MRFQPIEVSEVAARLAELVRGAPAGRVPDLAGPAVHTARDLAEATLTAYGRRHRVVGFRLPGGMGRALRQGANLAPDRAVGTVTFHDFLAARTAAAGPAGEATGRVTEGTGIKGGAQRGAGTGREGVGGSVRAWGHALCDGG